jgi:hypothetical protein
MEPEEVISCPLLLASNETEQAELAKVEANIRKTFE